MQRPIDARIRAMVRDAKVNQSHLARFLRRSQGWLNKYVSGRGRATIDDVVGMAAYFRVPLGRFIGPLTLPDARERHEVVSDIERRLLRAWRRVPPELQPAALDLVELFARSTRRARMLRSPTRSTSPVGRKAKRPRRRA
jgi:transcriptional regulator with XRE-family HTH domain